ncbi:MAG: TetR/AcrR family transcriptional regulator [Desulfatibacillaceae bacterium]
MDMDRSARKRAEILAAAMDVFAEKGYHATKISDIAKKLNMGHGTFYRYFKNKLDIFSSVVDEIIVGLTRVVELERPDQSNDLQSYRDQLGRIGQAMFRVFTEDPRMAQIVYYEALGVDPEVNARIERAMHLFDRFTEQYLVNGVAKGFLRPDLDTETLAKGINAMIFAGIKDVAQAGDIAERTERWIGAVSLLMLEGMAETAGSETGRGPAAGSRGNGE